MDKKIELRKNRIINLIYFAIILGLSYMFLKYCLWIVFPFLFAFFLAVIVQKPSNFITKKTKIGKGISSAAMILLTIIIIAVLIMLMGMRLVDAGKNLFEFVRGKIYDMPTLIENVRAWLVKTVSILPDNLENKAVNSLNNWFEVIKDKSASEIARIIVNNASSNGKKISLASLSTPLSGLWSTAKQIPSVFVAVLVTIVSACFMAAEYDWIVTFIKKQLPEGYGKKLSRSKRIVFQSIGKLIRSYLIIILITFTELFIGLNILSLVGLLKGGHVFEISLIIALLDILPVLGTGTFMVPWAIYSLITEKVGLGIGLLIIYAVISIARQVIEPKIVGGTVGLPPFVTLMSMYIGSQLFGFVGIFLLPILIIIIKLLNDEGIVHFWVPGDSMDENEKKEKPIPIYKRLFKKKR